MHTNKTIGKSCGYSEFMGSEGKIKMVLLILLLFALIQNRTYAFSIGPVEGVTCSSDWDFTPGCNHDDWNSFETVHQKITGDALSNGSVVFKFPFPGRDIKFGSNQIRIIQDNNMEVDRYQSIPELHFDNEEFIKGQNKLTELKNWILNSLRKEKNIDGDEIQYVRYQFGRYTHTLQDFFSHTSWVNIHPWNQDVPDVPKFWLGTIAFMSYWEDPCNTPGILATNYILTSGYAGSKVDLLLGLAPSGKCAHGLVGNGIHKDWDGRDFHSDAKAEAVYATKEFANYIINHPSNNPENVCLFMTSKPCGITWLKFKEGDPGFPGDGKILNLKILTKGVTYMTLLTPIKFKDIKDKNLSIGMFQGNIVDSLGVVYSNGLPKYNPCYMERNGIIHYSGTEIIYSKQGSVYFLKEGAGLTWGGIFYELDLINQERPSECGEITINDLSITRIFPFIGQNQKVEPIDGVYLRENK